MGLFSADKKAAAKDYRKAKDDLERISKKYKDEPKAPSDWHRANERVGEAAKKAPWWSQL